MNKHRLRGTRSILMGLALLLFVLGLSSAQSVTAAKAKEIKVWGGFFSSNWNDETNWLNGIPSNDDGVEINVVKFGSYPILEGLNITIDSLNIPGGILMINSNSSLTVKEGVSIGNTLHNGGNLIIGGDFINDGTYNAFGVGSVTLNGSVPQTLAGSSTTTFQNLTINNASGVTLGHDQIVEGSLNLTSGRLSLGSSNLILGEGASVTGGGSASTMVVADSSGEMRKRFASQGSFTFPVGTGTDGTDYDYSPMTINVTAGNFTGSPYVGVHVTDEVHENMISGVVDYISRFWTTSSTFSSVTADVTLNYLDADVEGDENQYEIGLYTGIWGTTTQYSVNPDANQITGEGFTTLSGDFSALNIDLTGVELAFFDATSADKYVLLSWATTFELNNLGFNLYRGIEGSRAPTIKINDQLIPSQAPGSGSGAYYEYRDYSVTKGVTYLYWLEDIDVNGTKTLYGPVSVTFAQ